MIAPFPEKFTGGPAVVVADDPKVLGDGWRDAIASDHARFICLLQSPDNPPDPSRVLPVFSFLAGPVRIETLCRVIAAAFESMAIAQRNVRLESELKRARSEIHQLSEIGIALSTERDRESLLDLILRKSREITNSDAGSLYLVEQDEKGARRLRFKFTQNDSMNVSFRESVLPWDSSSIAGYVATTGNEVRLADVYHIPPSLPFDFNRKFDDETGYRTKSMLAVPAKNPRGEIVATVQLINCKRRFDARLDRQNVHELVTPFPEECLVLLGSMAGQAAVAIENVHLYESIETLFEGFVRASVSAIESRDPTTHGHSFRVADLTVALAQAVDRDESAGFRDIHFSRAEMKEIRYASLLHDFGKVGVARRF